MALQRLDHYSIRTPRLDETRRFYAETMGLEEGPRPPFPFPGAWMYRADTAVVHTAGYDPDDAEGLKGYLGDKELVNSGTGAIDHVAFVADDLPAMQARLTAAGVAFRERAVPNLGLPQIFVEDPDGITIELNYPAAG